MKAPARLARATLLSQPSTSLLFLIVFAAGVSGACAQNPAITAPANCEQTVGGSEATATPLAPGNGRVPVPLQNEFDRVRVNSFPELADKVVGTRAFASSADYFQTRFSISRFLFLQRMHYFVEVNPRIGQSGPSKESVCAILAHELVHISRMSAGNRIRLLGLARLFSASYTARFERAADLEAIRRGYAPGLVSYREWVYKNIPAKALKQKRRNYFLPEEITAIVRLSEGDPGLFDYWKAHVPLDLEQIHASVLRSSRVSKK